jgi:SAM-dependent methyltransferase
MASQKDEKFILDATAGGRMMWFNKKHPNVLYLDKRIRPKGFLRVRPNFEIKPDICADFKNLPFLDNQFKLVVFDPPHTIRKCEDGGIIAERYGRLTFENWKETLKEGFCECLRVLEPGGILIFKWNEKEKKLKEILALCSIQPLFGHTTGSRSQTHWLCFMK